MVHFLAMCLCAVFLMGSYCPEAQGAESAGLYAAIEAVAKGTATEGQKAVVFAANDDINHMRLNGVITDRQYQASQKLMDHQSQTFGKNSTAKNNADFDVQVKNNPNYKEGTDSDYILKMKGKDPVQDIRRIQDDYNKQVNSYLRKHKSALAEAGLSTKPRYNWHNKLDVDFMVDPNTVTFEQFKEVAKLNNDAYKRPGAAKYEYVTRGGKGTLTPQDFKDYADEMRDFTQKKQRKLSKFRKNPSLLNDPMKQAEFHKVMALEQKYIDRTQNLVDKVRQQYGIKAPKYGGAGDPFYEVIVDPVQGTATMKRRLPGKLAAHGAKRSSSNLKITAAASSVATNSIRNSQIELATTIAQVDRQGKWPTAARDIAELTRDLPPSDKGRLIEQIAKRRGKVFASKVASEMRTLSSSKPRASLVDRTAAKIENTLKSLPGYTDDMSKVSATRAQLNRAGQTAMGIYGKYATANAYYQSLKSVAQNGYSYWEKITKATDPNTTDEEAQRLFEEATKISWELAKTNAKGVGIATMFAKTPTLAAFHTAWTLGSSGGEYFFNNTETGRYMMAGSLRATKATVDRYERGMDLLTEFTGGTSERMKDRQRADLIEEKFRTQLRLGNVVLNQDVHIDDVISLMRKGEYAKAKGLYKRPNVKGNPLPKVAKKPASKPKSEFISQTHPIGNEPTGDWRAAHGDPNRNIEDGIRTSENRESSDKDDKTKSPTHDSEESQVEGSSPEAEKNRAKVRSEKDSSSDEEQKVGKDSVTANGSNKPSGFSDRGCKIFPSGEDMSELEADLQDAKTQRVDKFDDDLSALAVDMKSTKQTPDASLSSQSDFDELKADLKSRKSTDQDLAELQKDSRRARNSGRSKAGLSNNRSELLDEHAKWKENQRRISQRRARAASNARAAAASRQIAYNPNTTTPRYTIQSPQKRDSLLNSSWTAHVRFKNGWGVRTYSIRVLNDSPSNFTVQVLGHRSGDVPAVFSGQHAGQVVRLRGTKPMKSGRPYVVDVYANLSSNNRSVSGWVTKEQDPFSGYRR